MGTSIEDWQTYRRAGDLGTLSLRIVAYAAEVDDMVLMAGPGPTPWLYDDRLRLQWTADCFSAMPPPQSAAIRPVPFGHGAICRSPTGADDPAQKPAEPGSYRRVPARSRHSRCGFAAGPARCHCRACPDLQGRAALADRHAGHARRRRTSPAWPERRCDRSFALQALASQAISGNSLADAGRSCATPSVLAQLRGAPNPIATCGQHPAARGCTCSLDHRRGLGRFCRRPHRPHRHWPARRFPAGRPRPVNGSAQRAASDQSAADLDRREAGLSGARKRAAVR